MTRRRFTSTALFLIVFTLLSALVPPTRAFGQLSFGEVTLFTDNRPSDDLILPGYILNIRAYVIDDLGDDNILSVIAYPQRLDLPPVTLQLGFGAEGKFNDVHPGLAPTYTDQTGQYLIVATNLQGETASFLTHNLDKPRKLDFPTKLSVSDKTTEPIFTFHIPPGANGVGINVIDLSDPIHLYSLWGSAYDISPGDTVASFQIPPGILSVGTQVILRAEAYDSDRLDPVVLNQDILENRSINSLYFTPVRGASVILTKLGPAEASVGGSDFTLTVNGKPFVPGSTVRWNGKPRATSFVSSTRLTSVIPASDIAKKGSALVTVIRPDGKTSNALVFRIGDHLPKISIHVSSVLFDALGGMILAVIVENTGGTATNLKITNAALETGVGTATPLPLPVASGEVFLIFPQYPDFTSHVLHVSGTYGGGSFSASTRFIVP